VKDLNKLIREILKDNPHADLKKILEGRAMIQKRRGIGRRRGYRLMLPMSGRRAQIADDENDRRTVQLCPF